MKISNYAMSKVEEMRRNNDEIENNREDKLYMNSVLLSESEEKTLRDRGVKENIKICGDCEEEKQ